MLPSLVAIGALFGYPVWLLLRISVQQLGLAELITRRTVWVGLANYAEILAEPGFWTVVGRTLAFTLANVALTMICGTAIGLLLVRLGRAMRLVVSTSLVLAWAVPIVTATVLWQWLFDSTYGVLNHVLTAVTPWDFTGHDWFATGLSTFGVITAIIVWQATPFVALTVQAGLLAVPGELYEAARMDGAGPWRTFRSITVPMIRPILTVLTFLSAIWDFKVFTQVWAVRQGGPDGQTVTLPVYLYDLGIASSSFGPAAAGAVLMVLILAVCLVFYLRRMLRTEFD
ncbi:sugar ABC transporter permease [Pilimelia anulata]|uniref:Sugar ABC transporter permease n=1 Tax=Pilimelia anulata TaxID=53371 RepID=A0A8J3B7B0_9ACTN|nr:sugar ABC transporter permease [Pilimelia anulata]